MVVDTHTFWGERAGAVAGRFRRGRRSGRILQGGGCGLGMVGRRAFRGGCRNVQEWFVRGP